jgi:hypothetical protein
MPRIPIGDGYELIAETKPTARTPAVKYVYRPPLPVDEFVHGEAQFGFDRKSGEDRAKELCEFLGKHLVSWDAVDGNGAIVTPSAAMLAEVRDLPFLLQIEAELLKSKTEVAAEAPKSSAGSGSPSPGPAGTVPAAIA